MQWFLVLFFVFSLNFGSPYDSAQIVFPKIYETNKIIEIDSLVLELKSNSDFLVDTSSIRWVGENDEVVDYGGVGGCDYQMGIVRGMPSVSRVVMTICNDKEITGYIQFGNVVRAVEPFKTGNSGAHLVHEGK